MEEVNFGIQENINMNAAHTGLELLCKHLVHTRNELIQANEHKKALAKFQEENGILQRGEAEDDNSWFERCLVRANSIRDKNIPFSLYSLFVDGTLKISESKKDNFRKAGDHLLRNVYGMYYLYDNLSKDPYYESEKASYIDSANEKKGILYNMFTFSQQLEKNEIIDLDMTTFLAFLQDFAGTKTNIILPTENISGVNRNEIVHFLEAINNALKATKELSPANKKLYISFENDGNCRKYTVINNGRELTPNIYNNGSIYTKEIDNSIKTQLYNNGEGLPLTFKDIVQNYGGEIKISSFTTKGRLESTISTNGVETIEDRYAECWEGENICAITLVVPAA